MEHPKELHTSLSYKKHSIECYHQNQSKLTAKTIIKANPPHIEYPQSTSQMISETSSKHLSSATRNKPSQKPSNRPAPITSSHLFFIQLSQSKNPKNLLLQAHSDSTTNLTLVCWLRHHNMPKNLSIEAFSLSKKIIKINRSTRLRKQITKAPLNSRPNVKDTITNQKTCN